MNLRCCKIHTTTDLVKIQIVRTMQLHCTQKMMGKLTPQATIRELFRHADKHLKQQIRNLLTNFRNLALKVSEVLDHDFEASLLQSQRLGLVSHSQDFTHVVQTDHFQGVLFHEILEPVDPKAAGQIQQMLPGIDVDLNAVRVNEAQEFIKTLDCDVLFDYLFWMRKRNV